MTNPDPSAPRRRAGHAALAGMLLVLSLVAHGARAESLYPSQGYRALGADHKAANIGDMLTIQVIETSSATSSADTSTDRHASNDLRFSLSRRPSTVGSLGVGSDFDGGGTTQRSGRLLALMTASVVGFAPNGDLLVSGEQLLTVNDEKQKILVKGRVRPDDISTSNVVLSTRLADAQIVYLGDGELAGHQRPAWWTRFLNWLGL